MSLFKEEMSADECVLLNMKEYSAYTIKSKFPNNLDGMKPIHRRILLTMHKNPSTAKEATVAGRVMEMHPHGDASISAAISGLAKPYANIVPLVDSNSNLGTYDGEDPAAARYLDVRESELAVDLFFRNTDPSTLKMIPCESEKGTEPANFVPIIPTALIFPVLGIGCGYKTETSAISLANCCAVAKKFVEMKYRDPDGYRKKIPSLSQYLIPDFPTYCVLRNAKQIISEYRKGNYDCPFVTDGIMEISKDSITLVTLPPDRSFGKVTEDAGIKTAQEKTSWLHEHFQPMADLAGEDQGCMKGAFVCPLRRGENPFEVLTMFKRQLQFTSIWKPCRLYNDEETGISAETPITLLEKWAKARYRVVLGGLKQKLLELQEQYRKLQALVIIVDHAKEVCDLFINSKDEEATVSILVKQYNLTPFQARYLQTLPLKRLTSKGKAELLAEIDEIKAKNLELQKKFTKIDEEIVATITAFENKFVKDYPQKCKIPEYIGTACYKGTGWILVESIKECDEILTRFDTDDIVLNLFPSDGKIVTAGSDDPEADPNIEISKHLHASYVGKSPTTPKYLAVHPKGGVAFIPKPSITGLIEGHPVPVGDVCTVIHKYEGRKIVHVDKSNIRQSLSVMTPAIKDVLGTFPIADEEVFVIHTNTKINGIVTIDRIKGNGKISRVPVGETKILGVYRITDPIMFSIPAESAVRTSIRHMYIKDLSKFVGPGQTLKLFLLKRKTSTEKDIAPYVNRSAIFTIKD